MVTELDAVYASQTGGTPVVSIHSSNVDNLRETSSDNEDTSGSALGAWS